LIWLNNVVKTPHLIRSKAPQRGTKYICKEKTKRFDIHEIIGTLEAASVRDRVMVHQLSLDHHNWLSTTVPERGRNSLSYSSQYASNAVRIRY
jgi:hypothetical protein